MKWPEWHIQLQSEANPFWMLKHNSDCKMDWNFRIIGFTSGYKTEVSQTQIYWLTLKNSCSLLMGLKRVVLRPSLYSVILTNVLIIDIGMRWFFISIISLSHAFIIICAPLIPIPYVQFNRHKKHETETFHFFILSFPQWIVRLSLFFASWWGRIGA